MVRAAWTSRGDLGWALDVLRWGVCSDCALGTPGWSDEVLPGLHLCEVRARGLRRWTRGPLDPAQLPDVEALRQLSLEELRSLGRVPEPLLWRCDQGGFSALSWSDALKLASERIASSSGRWRLEFEPAVLSNEGLFSLAQAARILAPAQVGPDRRGPFEAVSSSMEAMLGSDAATCSLEDLAQADTILLASCDLESEPLLREHLRLAESSGAGILRIDGGPSEDAETVAWRLCSILEQKGLLDREELAKRCSGQEHLFEALAGASEPGPGDRVEGEVLEELAKRLGESERVVLLLGAGLGEGIDPGGCTSWVLALALALGLPWRSGCGLIPVGWPAGHRAAEDLGLLGARSPWSGLSREPGVDVVYGVGTPGSSGSGGEVGFRIHQVLDLDPGLLEPAGEAVLLLPMQSRFELEGGGTSTSSDRRVRFSPEIRGHQVGTARPDWWIPNRITAAIRATETELFEDGDEVRGAMARSVPRYAGVDQLFAQGESFQWGGPAPWRDGFPTADGRACLDALQRPERGESGSPLPG